MHLFQFRDRIFETEIDSSDDGVVIVVIIDRKFKIQHINGSVERISGLKAEEVRGKSCTVLAKSIGCKEVCPSKGTLKDGNPRYKEYVLDIPRSKRIHKVHISSPIYEGRREVSGCVEVIREVTREKETEEGVRSYLEFLKKVVENSADAIITTNMEGRITFWNKGAEELYGYRSEDTLGKEIDFLYPDELKNIRKKWQKSILSGMTMRNVNTRIYNSNGDLVDISLTISPLRDPDGTPKGTVGISKDVTKIRRAERRVSESIEELEKWQRLTINRENRMVELKNEIKDLKKKLEEAENF